MYILGHASTPHLETHIGSSTQPVEALRAYNNTLRGARSAGVCVLICVPAWRQLAVRELVQLWHRSRKLYCRMRFGIVMAYDLGLQCYVAENTLMTAEARKTMPHIATRCSLATPLSATSDTPTASKRRGRRPSERDTAIANYVTLTDLTTERLGQIVQSTSVPPDINILASLDRHNTFLYQSTSVCFTIGKHGVVPRRPSLSGRKRTRHHSEDDDDEEDGSEAAIDDSDESVTIVASIPPPAPLRRRTPLDEAASRELSMYSTTSTNLDALESLRAASISTTAVGVAQTARAECSVLGTLDNRLLVARVDDCFGTVPEFRARPMVRLRLHRLHKCVCGAHDSFGTNGVCSNCYNTKHTARLFRTNVSRVKEQITHQPTTRSERRELASLMLASENDSPIEAFSRATADQLHQAFPRTTTSRHSTTTTKESVLIDQLLERSVTQ